MDIFIKRIYDVIEANNNLFVAAGLQPIKTIDRFRGQTLNPEQFEFYPLPALFIAWKINWVKSGKYYNGNADIEFHYVTDEPWETSNISTNHEDALKKAFAHNLLHKILDDVESPVTSKLMRLDDAPIDTGVICYTILRYTCNVYEADPIGSPQVEVGDATLQLTGKLVKKLD